MWFSYLAFFLTCNTQAGGDDDEDEEVDLTGGKKVGAKKMAKLEAKEVRIESSQRPDYALHILQGTALTQ